MTIEAIVKEDGTLVVKVPDRYRGKRVQVSIDEVRTDPTSQWNEISRIVKESERLRLPGRTHEDILAQIREFRESE